MKILTLVIIHDQEKVLLGLKKRGFGAGRWNGFGGKVEAGETPEQAAHRELEEESGVKAKELFPAGTLEFTFADGQHLLCHLFRGHEIIGEAVETEEMRPQWFTHHEIPYDLMWADDAHWLPHLLSGKNLQAFFEFDSEEGNTFSRHEINFLSA